MKIKVRLPGIFQDRASLEVFRDLLRDMLTYYALLGILLAVSRLFYPPSSIPDWVFLVSESVCGLIILIWIAAITTSNLKRLEEKCHTPQEKKQIQFLMFFSCVMLTLSLWAAFALVQK